MDDFPKRTADLLEAFTSRIRSLTVEPVAKVIKFITLGMVGMTLVGAALLFLLIGILRILGELVSKACDCSSYMEITYAAVGGVFLLVGALLWSRRTKTGDEEKQ